MKKDDIATRLLQRQCELIGITFEQFVENDRHVSTYNITNAQHEEWKEYCISELSKHFRLGKKYALRKFPWIDLQLGFNVRD